MSEVLTMLSDSYVEIMPVLLPAVFGFASVAMLADMIERAFHG